MVRKISRNLEECRGTPYSVETYWDEEQKLWVIQILDAYGNIEGSPEYAPNAELFTAVVKRKTYEAYARASEG